MVLKVSVASYSHLARRRAAAEAYGRGELSAVRRRGVARDWKPPFSMVNRGLATFCNSK